MPRAIRWKNLTIGLSALLAIGAVVLSVLLFARIGALHGPTSTLYLVTDEATGVIAGTEVWLSGQKIGVVKSISFRPASTDTTERLAIKMEVLTHDLARVRHDSDIEIRPGGNLIGAPVIYITSGTRASRPVVSGDTLRGRNIAEQRSVTADLTNLGDSIVAVAHEARQINLQLHSEHGPIGGIRWQGVARIAEVGSALHRLAIRTAHGTGTVAHALGDTALSAGVARLRAQTDSVQLLLASGRGTVGRFRRDSTLAPAAQRMLADATLLRTRFSDPVGSIVRSQGDSALVHQLDLVHVELDSLVRNLKKHPFRYLPF